MIVDCLGRLNLLNLIVRLENRLLFWRSKVLVKKYVFLVQLRFMFLDVFSINLTSLYRRRFKSISSAAYRLFESNRYWFLFLLFGRVRREFYTFLIWLNSNEDVWGLSIWPDLYTFTSWIELNLLLVDDTMMHDYSSLIIFQLLYCYLNDS